jgi:hypothetical protein
MEQNVAYVDPYYESSNAVQISLGTKLMLHAMSPLEDNLKRMKMI